jgi:transcriptional regulator with XRE-family HTH domain
MYVERINLICLLAGISQSRLAKELGISKQALNNYVTGKRKFSNVVRIGILKQFDLPSKVFEQHQLHLVLKGDKLIVL